MSEPNASLEASYNLNLSEAYNAGVRSATPESVLDGVFAHHKDTVLTDRREAHLKQLKAEKVGPDNPAGVIHCYSVESFITFVTAHKESRTAIFANPEGKSIRAIFDFREAHDDQGAANGWGQFSAQIILKESRKLKEWKKTTELMSQVDFANFIEDHVDDVLEPSGVDILAIATDLEASSSGSFAGRVNLQNGNVSLNYQDETKTSIEVPKEIVLAIPLFENGPRYKLRARLRYQVGGASVKFRLLFVTLADAIDQEFTNMVEDLNTNHFPDHLVILGEASLPW